MLDCKAIVSDALKCCKMYRSSLVSSYQNVGLEVVDYDYSLVALESKFMIMEAV